MMTLHELVEYADTWKNKYTMNGTQKKGISVASLREIEIEHITVRNLKIVEKLVFLFNHLIQYHVVDYKEVIRYIVSV